MPQEQDGKLHFVGSVKTEAEKNEIWMAIKTIPTWQNDIVADIKVTGGPEPAASAKTYTVKSGDTLSGIAKSQLGSAGDYMKIFEANTRSAERSGQDQARPGSQDSLMIRPAALRRRPQLTVRTRPRHRTPQPFVLDDPNMAAAGLLNDMAALDSGDRALAYTRAAKAIVALPEAVADLVSAERLRESRRGRSRMAGRQGAPGVRRDGTVADCRRGDRVGWRVGAARGPRSVCATGSSAST